MALVLMVESTGLQEVNMSLNLLVGDGSQIKLLMVQHILKGKERYLLKLEKHTS
jgi:hypothetical protein